MLDGGTVLHSMWDILLERYPTCVPRKLVGEATGGLIKPKTMANLDSLKQGPLGAFRMGSQVAYPTKNFVEWLESRTSGISRN